MDVDDDTWLITAAHAVGANATAWYLAGLVTVLLATAAAWRLFERVAPHLPHPRRLPPPAFLALCLGVGFIVIAAAAGVFAEMAEAMHADEALGRADDALTSALRQSVSPGVLAAFALFTHLADPATLITLGLAMALWLWWRQRRWLALGWSIALVGNGLLNPLLKSVFERVRPLHEHGLAAASGYSFPSGHSSGAVVAYGMLAYVLLRQLPRRWHGAVLMGFAALVFTVGCSRIFLQVHYASDVLAGFASGSAWLAVCVASIEALRGHRRLRAVGVSP